tara:strand:- start:9704 stop:9916 length:213 start_codon:yes stop_codon:yes gene_type:complete
MPIFDYKCNNCCVKFEELILSKNDEPAKCPFCKNSKIEKIMSVPAAFSLQSETKSESACPCGDKQGTGFS